MCKFCEIKGCKYSDNVPIGIEMKCADDDRLYCNWCIVHENKHYNINKPMIVVDADGDTIGFDFTYCPICGRKVN